MDKTKHHYFPLEKIIPTVGHTCIATTFCGVVVIMFAHTRVELALPTGSRGISYRFPWSITRTLIVSVLQAFSSSWNQEVLKPTGILPHKMNLIVTYGRLVEISWQGQRLTTPDRRAWLWRYREHQGHQHGPVTHMVLTKAVPQLGQGRLAICGPHNQLRNHGVIMHWHFIPWNWKTKPLKVKTKGIQRDSKTFCGGLCTFHTQSSQTSWQILPPPFYSWGTEAHGV